jgi:hypothetical protein
MVHAYPNNNMVQQTRISKKKRKRAWVKQGRGNVQIQALTKTTKWEKARKLMGKGVQRNLPLLYQNQCAVIHACPL